MAKHPRKRRQLNPTDADAIDKKRQEAIDRMGKEKYEEYVWRAHDEYHEIVWEWEKYEERDVGAYESFAENVQDRFDSGKIDRIDYYVLHIQWLRDDRRRMDRERREKSDQDVDMDAIIRDLKDEEAMDKKRLEKRLEAIDRRGGRDNYEDDLFDAKVKLNGAIDKSRIIYNMFPDFRGDYADFVDDINKKYYSGEIDEIERVELEAAWINEKLEEFNEDDRVIDEEIDREKQKQALYMRSDDDSYYYGTVFYYFNKAALVKSLEYGKSMPKEAKLGWHGSGFSMEELPGFDPQAELAIIWLTGIGPVINN